MIVDQLLGLDVGIKRTGIARASSAAKLAEPIKTVATDDIWESLKNLIEELQPATIVVGLPRNLKGDDTDQTRWVRLWLTEAKQRFPSIDFILQDEALTTKLAESRAGKKITDVDAHAAAIILQDFLDTNENHK
jgi:putative Holliday junction resolvase